MRLSRYALLPLVDLRVEFRSLAGRIRTGRVAKVRKAEVLLVKLARSSTALEVSTSDVVAVLSSGRKFELEAFLREVEFEKLRRLERAVHSVQSELFVDGDGAHRFRFRKDGQVVAVSCAYVSKASASAGLVEARRLRRREAKRAKPEVPS